MEIRDYAKILARWLWLLILGMVVAMTASYFAYRYFSPWPQYEATVTVLVGDDSVTPQLAPDAVQMLRATYIQLASRRPVTQQVVDALNLSISSEELSELLRVAPVSNTRLIDISAVAGDPAMAASIANEVAEQLKTAPSSSDDAAAISPIQVLAPAQIPGQPRLAPYIGILIAGVLGLTITTGIVLLIEHMDTTIRSARDVVEKLGVPLAGVVSLQGAISAPLSSPAASYTVQEQTAEPVAVTSTAMHGSVDLATVESAPQTNSNPFVRTSPPRPPPPPRASVERPRKATRARRPSGSGPWASMRNRWRRRFRKSQSDQTSGYAALKFSEACRLVRANVCHLAGRQDGLMREHEIIFITSPEPIVGRSIFVQGLVNAWAESEHNVAYVRVHNIASFARSQAASRNGQGMRNTNVGPSPEVGRDPVTKVTRYDLVTESQSGSTAIEATLPMAVELGHAGNGDVDRVPVLTPVQMQEALLTLGETARVVIVDGPTVLLSADAAILSAQATGTVLVVEADSTSLESAREAISMLTLAGGNVLGVVLIA